MESPAVETVIREKTYYAFDPQTHAYDWKASVSKIAEALGRPQQAEDIRTVIEACFTPDCLTQVKMEKDGEEQSVVLIKAVCDLGLKPHIWTVGDQQWQETKFNNCGVSQYVNPKDYHFASQNKVELIKQFIEQYQPEPGKTVYLYVVDDKDSILAGVMKLEAVARDRAVVLHNYHLKLADPQADPTAFYQWLQQQLEKLRDNQTVELFLDMDGVVIDTDATMNRKVVEALAQWLKQHP